MSMTPVLVGLGTFLVCLALCVALFLALDVEMLFLVGPAIGIAIGSYGAYKSAARDL